ncbi:MAG: peptidoglycan DD-metalloendopeptidase family protein [Oscillibacter sp.]|nr:peptidoglycan DD-metalloendopeptidase family protein [Oscillibacter sp.]
MRLDVLKAVGEASLSAAVMILAVLILRLRFQDRTPRKAFCLLWDMVLVRLLVPGAFPSPVSVRRWLPALGTRPVTAVSAPSVVTGVTEEVLLTRDALVIQTEGLTCLMEGAAASGTAPVRPSSDWSAALPPLDWGMVLTALWLAAAILLAGGFLWSHLRSRAVYADSLPCRDGFVLDWLTAHPLRRPVQARTSDRIAAPLTYGILYPVILLPRGIEDRTDLSFILAHEHTHIRRFDALRKALLAAALCIHWFNPLVWVMYVLTNRDIELNCDEAVLRGGADRERYALALLSMEERRGGWSPSGSHFSGHALEERIKAIMNRKHSSVTALLAVLVVMCVTTTVFASAAPEEKEDPHRNAPEAATYVYNHLGMVEDNGVTIMANGETGERLYSVDDGKTWMSEERYQAEYGSWGGDWQVEWWTYEDYKAWLEEEKAALQSIIGERGYNSTMGWFTWDQQKVDEAIAMYEDILEKIKNGALYSRTIIDKNGNEIGDVALGSDGPLDLFVASTFDETDMVSVAPKAVDTASLLEELKAFGIGGSASLMTYNGELIRTFVDGASVGDSGYSIQYVYTNPDGVVDVHTLRAVIYNPDGSYDNMGGLIGLAAKGDRGFDQELIDCAEFDRGPQATAASVPYHDQDWNVSGKAEVTIAEGTSGQGKTFEEIFAQYEEYGLIYRPREGGMGSMTFNGQPVRSFADLKPDGGVFSCQDPYASDGLTVRTEYDEDGRLLGLAADPAPLKDYSTEKQELGFDCSAPVRGRLSRAFGEFNGTFHYGVDLAAAKGADVTAFADGTVSETGFSPSMGNYVVLSHADGYSTLYAHCGSVAVTVGDSVAMGRKIAEVGASGMATGPVLHFELRSGSTYLDPGAYLEMAV